MEIDALTMQVNLLNDQLEEANKKSFDYEAKIRELMTEHEKQLEEARAQAQTPQVPVPQHDTKAEALAQASSIKISELESRINTLSNENKTLTDQISNLSIENNSYQQKISDLENSLKNQFESSQNDTNEAINEANHLNNQKVLELESQILDKDVVIVEMKGRNEELQGSWVGVFWGTFYVSNCDTINSRNLLEKTVIFQKCNMQHALFYKKSNIDF